MPSGTTLAYTVPTRAGEDRPRYDEHERDRQRVVRTVEGGRLGCVTRFAVLRSTFYAHHLCDYARKRANSHG